MLIQIQSWQHSKLAAFKVGSIQSGAAFKAGSKVTMQAEPKTP
jgi:hypothetical protein